VGLSKSETLPTNASYLTPIQEKFITMHSELQTLVDMAQENLVHMKQLLEAGAQQLGSKKVKKADALYKAPASPNCCSAQDPDATFTTMASLRDFVSTMNYKRRRRSLVLTSGTSVF
jgi:hypothetical protein